MIIVLFHVLYYLGKYVYDNFHPRIDKTEDVKPAVQLLNVTEADYRDPMKSEHIADEEQNFVVKFFPPVYVQRYTTVLDVLASPQYFGKIKKVIDFGCAELSMAVLLKNAGVEEIYCVDIDRSLLEKFQSRVAPLHCDYLSLRTQPLSIHVCEGSVAHNDTKFERTDAVVCIELIEHLYPDDLDAFPYNVFGFIKPQVAIVTTPNADFNVLFKGLNGFRHADHKFEWTRSQFQDWANNIVVRYPDYEVSFHGIGSGPGGTEHLGSCSQMAVFHRHSESYDERPEGIDDLLKTVVSHKYPYRVDNRSDEEKILDEAVYYIRLYSAREEEYSEEIPLEKLMFSVEKFRISVEILKSILEEANWGIAEREDGPVVLIPPQSTLSTYSGADFDDFLETDYRHNDDSNDWNALDQGAPRSIFTWNNEERENWEDPAQETLNIAPRSMFTWDNEERENWDDPTQDTLNSENLPNSELLDQTSDSQWTVEDLNNEDPQQTEDTSSRGLATETELPSDSLSIGLDPSNIDYLNASIGTIDLSENDLSSTQSLGTAGRLASNENSALPRDTERRDGPISLQHTENEDQACVNISTTESERYKCTLQEDVRSISEEAASPRSQHVPEIDETDCNSVCNESSSVSTIEATCLLSHEQSLVDEKDGESLINDQSIDSLEEKRVTALSENDEYHDLCSMNIQPSCISVDSPYAQNEISHMVPRDLSSDRHESYENLDISYVSIDSSHQKSEADLIGIKKLRSEEIKSQDSMSFKSISDCSLDLKPKYTSSPQVCTNDDQIQERNARKDRRFLDEQNHKSTDSASQNEPRSVQSLDIKNTDFGNGHDPGIKVITTAALQSQNDENVPNREYLSEGEKIDENDASNSVEKVSPNTSQLSLQSNSDISLSTATSTGSSNIEKWYSAEANPMYRRDLVSLKGGSDMADNPSDETSDSDVTSVSSSDKDRESEANRVKDRISRLSDQCYKPVRNNQTPDELKEAKTEDLDPSKKSSDVDTVKYYPDDLLRGKMNDKLLPCLLRRRNRVASTENSRFQGATMKDISSVKKISLNIRLDQSIGTQDEPIVMMKTISSSFTPDCPKQDQTIHRDLEIERNSDKIDTVLREADTSGAPTPFSKANSSVDQEVQKSDVYEVTKTFAESTEKLFEKVDAISSTLETTKRLAEIRPLVAGRTESDVEIKGVRMVNDFQNTSRQRPFLFSTKDSDDNEHQAERSCDLRPFGCTTQTRNNDFQILDAGSGISACKPTTSIGASVPCNMSKIGEERSRVNNGIDDARGFENAESNQFSPESLDTPPNSWSPEIMDSGYPNSASVHDSTPEYELSSIANDRISDSDSASIEDIPVPAAYEFLEVENGDLANNNRDNEGNNVVAFQADDLDDLQPLIDVLENDMENENDIYVLQNGFPMWLLRILEMANPIDLEGIGGQQAQLYPAPLEQAGGDAANVNAENDEGFDSSSSEDESDVDDDEADDATTVSSSETDEQSAENIVRDWRAGGDP